MHKRKEGWYWVKVPDSCLDEEELEWTPARWQGMFGWQFPDDCSFYVSDEDIIVGPECAMSEGATVFSPTIEGAPTQASADVLAERRRQIEAEGWSAEHDDQHEDGELAIAAGWYALNARSHNWSDSGLVSNEASVAHSLFFGRYSAYRWPWHREWWKPKAQRRDLVRAAALILAEIERLDRAAQRQGGEA